MSVARWKDLCIDATDPRVAADFWSAALDLQVEMLPDGDAVLRGQEPGETIWIDRVPEPKSAKNRVHLDLVRADVLPLTELGARVVREVHAPTADWQLMTDPEGNEFCVFDRNPDAPTGLVVDSAEPVEAARWWAEVLGAELRVTPDGQLRWLGNVDGLAYDVVKFVGVAEPKTVKNRWHWDVRSDDVPALVARGARVVREPDDEVRWHVLADPQGNEFCVDPAEQARLYLNR